MDNYKTISTERVFKGRIIDVDRDIIILPDGKEAVRDVVVHPGGACVLPVDNGEIIFVRQYRHPLKRYTLEIPAGLLEPGEEPIDCAKRELEEETGYTSDDITPFTYIHSSPGFTSENIHIFFAENLKPGKKNPDDDEFVDIGRYPIDKALEMVCGGKVNDGKTVAAVLGYCLKNCLY